MEALVIRIVNREPLAEMVVAVVITGAETVALMAAVEEPALPVLVKGLVELLTLVEMAETAWEEQFFDRSGGSLALTKVEVSGSTVTAGSAGSGVGDTGSLRSVSGNNGFSGAITQNSDSRINSDAATLTLSGNIGGSGHSLTVGGEGNTTISGIIGTGTRGLIKDGNGILLLSGANTYSGVTTVSNGNLRLSGGSAVRDISAVSVSNGATLDLNGIAPRKARRILQGESPCRDGNQ